MSNGTLNRLLRFDEEAATPCLGRMAGVDEAGRGPLAGPVVAAAVIFCRKGRLQGLNDSKKVTPRTREVLYREIACVSLIGIGCVDERKIDEINIYQATRLAMKYAVLSLSRTPDLILIDGNMRLDIPVRQQPIIGGDGKSAAVAAASIIAKVYRDAWMMRLDRLYPEYRFKDHKGYPTPAHIDNLRRFGPSPVHRKSFSPVRDILEMAN